MQSLRAAVHFMSPFANSTNNRNKVAPVYRSSSGELLSPFAEFLYCS